MRVLGVGVALGVVLIVGAISPANARLSLSEMQNVCVNKGFAPETADFSRCLADQGEPQASSSIPNPQLEALANAPLPKPEPYVDPAFAARQSECLSYGAQPGTPGYINCMTQLSTRDLQLQQQRDLAARDEMLRSEAEAAARNERAEAERRAAIADIFRRQAVQPVYVPPVYQLPPPVQLQMPRSTHCTSRASGGAVYTDCNN